MSWHRDDALPATLAVDQERGTLEEISAVSLGDLGAAQPHQAGQPKDEAGPLVRARDRPAPHIIRNRPRNTLLPRTDGRTDAGLSPAPQLQEKNDRKAE